MRKFALILLSLGIGLLLSSTAFAEEIIECFYTTGGGIDAQSISVDFDLKANETIGAFVSGTQASITITKLPQRIVASSNGFQEAPTVNYIVQGKLATYRLTIEIAAAPAGTSYSYSYSVCHSV